MARKSRKINKICLYARCGDLIVIDDYRYKHRNHKYIYCQCDCGKVIKVREDCFASGVTWHCHNCINHPDKFQHGKWKTSEFGIWAGMLQRCYNQNAYGYNRYGGRGITVCESWKSSFQCFYDEMGQRPSKKHTIDRIDNDGNYCKENCRWATSKQQHNNRSNNRYIEFNGVRRTATEWAEFSGIDVHVMYGRINDGWSIERALTTPKEYRRPRVK